MVSAHLIAICGAVHVHVGEAAKGLEHLDRLMGWTILSESASQRSVQSDRGADPPDGVVGHHEQESKTAEGRHTEGAQSVASEVQKGRAEGTEPAMGEDAVADSDHAMLPHTEAKVSAARAVSLEISRALPWTGEARSGGVRHLQGRQIGRGQVG
jgi:hypothetical protein